MNVVYTLMKAIFSLPVFLYRTKVINKDKYTQDEAQILISNHLKWVDVPLLACKIPHFRHYIAKKELAKNKIVAWGMRAMEMVLVDRGKAELGPTKQIIKYLKNGESICMFPEGTRNRDNEEIQEAKAGVVVFALKGGNVPIVPAIIYRKAKFFRKNYIYIDEPFKLDEFAGKPLNAETMAAATKVVENKMKEARLKLVDYVENKRWKDKKKNKKNAKKEAARLSSTAKKQDISVSYGYYPESDREDENENTVADEVTSAAYKENLIKYNDLPPTIDPDEADGVNKTEV